MKFTLNDIHYSLSKLNCTKSSIIIIRIDESQTEMDLHPEEIRSTTDQITNALDIQLGVKLPILIIPRNYDIDQLDRKTLESLLKHKIDKEKKSKPIKIGKAYE